MLNNSTIERKVINGIKIALAMTIFEIQNKEEKKRPKPVCTVLATAKFTSLRDNLRACLWDFAFAVWQNYSLMISCIRCFVCVHSVFRLRAFVCSFSFAMMHTLDDELFDWIWQLYMKTRVKHRKDKWA